VRVDPDEFAAQLNYLAAIGRMIVPRAFAFAGQKVLFVGHAPFNAEELGSLLPEESRDPELAHSAATQHIAEVESWFRSNRERSGRVLKEDDGVA
jgi:hypothetical protein